MYACTDSFEFLLIFVRAMQRSKQKERNEPAIQQKKPADTRPAENFICKGVVYVEKNGHERSIHL